jgi:hypothetical protein
MAHTVSTPTGVDRLLPLPSSPPLLSHLWKSAHPEIDRPAECTVPPITPRRSQNFGATIGWSHKPVLAAVDPCGGVAESSPRGPLQRNSLATYGPSALLTLAGDHVLRVDPDSDGAALTRRATPPPLRFGVEAWCEVFVTAGVVQGVAQAAKSCPASHARPRGGGLPNRFTVGGGTPRRVHPRPKAAMAKGWVRKKAGSFVTLASRL